jgi:hypothetical protein
LTEILSEQQQWRRLVEDRIKAERELTQLEIKTFDEQQKREHMKTRFWVLLVTAPAWGSFASTVLQSISPAQGTLGSIAATLLGGGVYALRGVIRGSLN